MMDFGAPLRLGLGLEQGRSRPRIEHGDAAIERIVHLRVAVGFRVLLAVGHSAECRWRSTF